MNCRENCSVRGIFKRNNLTYNFSQSYNKIKYIKNVKKTFLQEVTN